MAGTVDITITDEGPDKGKRFVIRKLNGAAAEDIFARVVLTLAKAGTEVPLDLFSLKSGDVVRLLLDGLRRVPWEEAKPLLNMMMGCVDRLHADGTGALPLTVDDCDELRTRLLLRRKVFELNAGMIAPTGTIRH